MQRIFVPSGRVRLARLEERLLPAFRQALRRVAFDVLSSNGLQRSLTASLESRGDLDPITKHWGKQVPHLNDQVETAYKAAARQMASAREFKPYHHEIMNLVTAEPLDKYLEQVNNRVVGIGDTMFKDAAHKLSGGLQAGATEPELAALVRHSLNVTVQRSDTIARTEALGALNAADTAVYRAAGTQGLKLAREWIASEDERTREAHAEADGQVVALDESFDVDGEALEYPGDPSGSPENVINCRCTTAPVQVEEAVQAGQQFAGDTPVTPSTATALDTWVQQGGSGLVSPSQKSEIVTSVITHGEKVPVPLLRGANEKGTVASLKRKYAVGKEIDMVPASFSEDIESALPYAENGDNQPIIFHMKSGVRHGLNVSGRAEHQAGFLEKEWILAGRFYSRSNPTVDEDGMLHVYLSEFLNR